MEEVEIWKDILDYNGIYQVSDTGKVRSLKRTSIDGKKIKGRILKQGIDGYGYRNVTLWKEGIGITKKVHQLVAIAFLKHVPCGLKLVVNHKNFIRTDNNINNLEIVTQRENANLKHIKSTSEYIGVSWYSINKRWVSKIVINGKRKYLGSFKNEIDAHLSYQKALKELE